MTHGNGTLDLPGGANITTAASDVGEFVSTAANVVTCVNYTKRDGTAVVLADNSITLAKMAGGTDGQVITYDASGDPVAVGPGSDGEVLTSTGAGSPPAFEAAAGGGGKVVQVVNVQTGAVATGSTIFNSDDTIPQITEGNEFMTLAVTPTNASNKLIIEVISHISGSAGVAQDMIGALFNTDNHSTNALATSFVAVANAYGIHSHPLRFYVAAGTTSATTFRFRGGSASSGSTCVFNGLGATSGRYFGGAMISSITITEIEV